MDTLFIIIVIITLGASFGLNLITNNLIERIASSILLLVSAVIFILLILGNESEEAYINSLNGKNPYEMKLLYDKQDSTYVAIDTLYIKKE